MAATVAHKEEDEGSTVASCFTLICLSAAEAHFIIRNIGDDCTLASLHKLTLSSLPGPSKPLKFRRTQGGLAANRHNYCPQKLSSGCSKAPSLRPARKNGNADWFLHLLLLRCAAQRCQQRE